MLVDELGFLNDLNSLVQCLFFLFVFDLSSSGEFLHEFFISRYFPTFPFPFPSSLQKGCTSFLRNTFDTWHLTIRSFNQLLAVPSRGQLHVININSYPNRKVTYSLKTSVIAPHRPFWSWQEGCQSRQRLACFSRTLVFSLAQRTW